MTKLHVSLRKILARWPTILVWAAAAMVTLGLLVLLTRFANMMDLEINLRAGDRLLAGEQVYDVADPEHGFTFTHTPFAALIYAAFSLLGSFAAPVWTALSLIALLRVCYLMVLRMDPWLPNEATTTRTVGLACSLVVLTPFISNLRLGQISIFILWTAAEAFLSRRPKVGAVLLGIATAARLTPLGFIVLLPLVNRTREGIISLVSAASCTALAFVILPAPSRSYFQASVIEAERIGGAPEMVSNQSINGLLWRVLGQGGAPLVWLICASFVMFVCWFLGRRNWSQQQTLTAVGVVALGILLASPVSWDHHWVIAAPVLCGLFVLATRLRSKSLWTLLVITYIVFFARVIWLVPHFGGVEFSHSGWQVLAANSYVLIGIALIAAVALSTRTSSSTREPETVPERQTSTH
jgi:alpha-1,2-mannosyltransferase